MNEQAANNVIQIGDFSFEQARRFEVRRRQGCAHRRMELEEHGEIVRCRDCSAQVTAWWALRECLWAYTDQMRAVRAERDGLAKDRKTVIHLVAARAVERAWRTKNMVPTCPHCHAGITPDDGFGRSMVHRDFEDRRRRVKTEARNGEAPHGD